MLAVVSLTCVPQLAEGMRCTFPLWVNGNRSYIDSLKLLYGLSMPLRQSDITEGTLYGEWLRSKTESPRQISAVTDLPPEKIKAFVDGNNVPTVDEHWRIAEAIGSTYLEAALVLGYHFFNIERMAEPALRHHLEKVAGMRPSQTVVRSDRFRHLGKLERRARVVLTSGLNGALRFPNEDALIPAEESQSLVLDWIKKGFMVTGLPFPALVNRYGLDEQFLREVMSGDLAPPVPLLVILAVEFETSLEQPFLMLAFEKQHRQNDD